MDFIKKHYEKVLLGLVLVGLAVGAAFLPFMITGERHKLEEQSANIINRAPKALPPVDFGAEQALIARANARVSLDFSTAHKLVNPVLWQKGPDGKFIKVVTGKEVGPAAVVATKKTPLYLIVTLDSVTTADAAAVRYLIGAERQAAVKPELRKKKQYSASSGNKNDLFVIREVKGPPDNPTELVIEFNDSPEAYTLTKEKPIQRVEGYMADLKYDPEKKTWANQRVGAVITLAGETYNVVAITENEVVLSAKSNQKKYLIPFNSEQEAR